MNEEERKMERARKREVRERVSVWKVHGSRTERLYFGSAFIFTLG